MNAESIIAADGFYLPPQPCACRAGVRLSLSRAQIRACLAGPYLARGDAIRALTAGQLDRLFPTKKEARCGGDHRRAARQLAQMATTIPAPTGTDSELDPVRAEIRAICAPLSWRALIDIVRRAGTAYEQPERTRLQALLRAATTANVLRGAVDRRQPTKGDGRRDEREEDREG